ncbi:MAG: hypothetical protein K9G46_14885 [Flavobacteriales bacterium]|jgi:hypothetical protein|nr:hypothetical protein [Flavobacteriales bacterium]
MDPNYFVMDFPRVAEVFLAITVIALMVERVLALIFESRFYLEKVEYRVTRKPKKSERIESSDGTPAKAASGKIIGLERKAPAGLKEMIAFAVSLFVCYYWKFDAMTIIMPIHVTETWPGMILSAAIIAGGSKAAIKLFKDWLDVKSTAKTEIEIFKKSQDSKS